MSRKNRVQRSNATDRLCETRKNCATASRFGIGEYRIVSPLFPSHFHARLLNNARRADSSSPPQSDRPGASLPAQVRGIAHNSGGHCQRMIRFAPASVDTTAAGRRMPSLRSLGSSPRFIHSTSISGSHASRPRMRGQAAPVPFQDGCKQRQPIRTAALRGRMTRAIHVGISVRKRKRASSALLPFRPIRRWRLAVPYGET
jgi:hypothetical protein